MNLNMKDKTIIVTGGAKGIGAAVAIMASEEGATPVVLDLDEIAGNHLIKQLGRGEFIHTDLREEKACKVAVETVVKHYNRIDMLVNNAGINDLVGLEATNEAFISSLHTNLIHYFTMTKLCWPHLKAVQGSIVNVASKTAIIGQGGTSGYIASKGAILALTKEWAVEGTIHNVRVNAVLPAEVYTPMYESWLMHKYKDKDKAAEMKQAIENKIPLGKRMTTPEELAKTVLYLASAMSSHTTGSFLYTDGGYVHIRS